MKDKNDWKDGKDKNERIENLQASILLDKYLMFI